MSAFTNPKLDLVFVVDPLDRLNPGHDTSVALMEAAQERGHRIFAADAGSLGARDGRATAVAAPVRLRPAELRDGHWHTEREWYQVGRGDQIVLDDADAVFMRVDPPFDDRYLRATYLLDLVDQSSTVMVNAPAGLRNANEKLFALQFPELGPPTLVSADIAEITAATAAWGTGVLKPTEGMAGRGILLLRPDDPNLKSILEVATSRGRDQVVVQRFIAESVEGDRRIIVLDGEPIGALRRVAVPGDFRCNMAAGAAPVADTVTPRDKYICGQLAPKLAEHGLHFTGIDVIGDYLTEINVTSPTGIREIDALCGGNLAEQVIRWTEGRRTALRRRSVQP